MDPLTDLGVAVAGEVATSSLAEIKKHVAYLYKYKDNLKALEEAKRQLDAKRSDAMRFSGKTDLSVRDVSDTVKLWQSDAEKLDQMALNVISKANISCLNLRSRYSSSKRALELTQNIDEKVKNAPNFGTSFDRPIAEGAKFNLRGYVEFESRRRIQDEVLDALRKDDVTMCSICGMGGIGKTTLAKKLVKKVEADRLFDKVAMVTVSQNPNFEEIQKGIIDSLGLKFEESAMPGRANKLHDWLSNHMTLLILDDVWWQLDDDDFEKVGIPVASNRCKIVFTSRNIDECKKMGSEPNFPLNVLDAGEALELFVQNAGKCTEERNLHDKARQIVDECHGLPISIVTIAKALKDKPVGEWNDSLKKLQESNLPGISDMDKVYSKIQVSFDLLKDTEAQLCLRLCCLFPEDYDVPVEKLVFYGWGLELFNGVYRLKEARDRVDLIVHKLKSSFLLLDGEKKGYVKLHDIVRDFAVWISSKDENPYLVKCEKEMTKWPENFQHEKSGMISFVCQEMKNHPIGLRCPNLKLLRLHSQYVSDELPNGFFDGMEELRVVDLYVKTPLRACTMQKALRTLLVRYNLHQTVSPCYFREMLGESDMKNLEIFSLSSVDLSEFPVEMKFMHNLRCVRFIRASFEYMPPGVLLNLNQLEELELPPTFNDWGLQKKGRINASLDEIESLPLTSLTIGLRKGSSLEENTLKSITSFRIFIESDLFYDINLDSNILAVREVENACGAVVKWTSSLLRQCHKFRLDRVDFKYLMCEQLGGNNYYQIEYFSQLRSLKMWSMDSLEEILHGTYLSSIQEPCFTNLTEIVIGHCPKLKRAFPISVARELTQLQSMDLYRCIDLEAIFYEDQVDSGTQAESSGVKLDATSKETGPKQLPTYQNMEQRIEEVGKRVLWSRLRTIGLYDMDKLRVVYNGNHAIECPSLEHFTIRRCSNMEGLSYGSFNSRGPERLELKRVGHLKNISGVLPLEPGNGILQLRELDVDKCHEMKYLADATAGPNLLKTFFSCLESLRAWKMESLEEIWNGPYLSKIHAQCFSNLTRITIYECPKMKRLFPLPVATNLRQLKDIWIDLCEEMEEIFFEDQVDNGNQVASSARLNDPTIETATRAEVVNPNEDEKSSAICPTPTSFIQCLRTKGKQPKHLPYQNITEHIEKEIDIVIVWPRLERLFLRETPKLRVMYNGDHAIECPSLEKLLIDGCNNMEGLSYGSFIAPKTKNLLLKGSRHVKNIPEWLHLEQDSGTIPQLTTLWMHSCDGIIYLVDAMTDRNLLKTLFSGLEELSILNMVNLEEIWHRLYLSSIQAQPWFSHLALIQIIDCPKLKHVFPLSIATKLTQLQKLEIGGCGEMEEIFFKDQVGNRNQKASSEEFYSQTTGTASAPSSFLSTHQENMEGNTAKLEETATIIFRQLYSLRLYELPKLRIFYDENHEIELPSLGVLTIEKCNKIAAFSNGLFRAPNLDKIKIDFTEYPCGDDLNTTVKKKDEKEQGGEGQE